MSTQPSFGYFLTGSIVPEINNMLFIKNLAPDPYGSHMYGPPVVDRGHNLSELYPSQNILSTKDFKFQMGCLRHLLSDEQLMECPSTEKGLIRYCLSKLFFIDDSWQNSTITRTTDGELWPDIYYFVVKNVFIENPESGAALNFDLKVRVTVRSKDENGYDTLPLGVVFSCDNVIEYGTRVD